MTWKYSQKGGIPKLIRTRSQIRVLVRPLDVISSLEIRNKSFDDEFSTVLADERAFCTLRCTFRG